MVPSSPPEAWRDFSLMSTVRTWRIPRNETHQWEPPLPLRSGPAGFLTLSPRLWAPKFITTVQVFLPWCWLLWRLLIQETMVFLNWPASLSSLGGSDLIYDLSSHTDLKWAVNFSVCSPFFFSFWLGWAIDFQAFYMLDWKLTGLLFYSLFIFWVLKIKHVTYNYISLHMYYQEVKPIPVPSALLLKASLVSNFLWLLPGISSTGTGTCIFQ